MNPQLPIRALRTLLSFVLLLTAATAQRVVVIDAAGGLGTNHTTLAAAFADLMAGDVLIVRAGTYTGDTLTTAHSFVMLGEGGPIVEPVTGTGATIEITMTGGTSQRIALRGLTCRSLESSQWALEIDGGAGFGALPTVNIENCTIETQSPFAERLALRAKGVGLTVRGCTLNTSSIDACIGSFVESTITGLDLSQSGGFTQFAQQALDVRRSHIWIVDSTLRAGSSMGVVTNAASCIGFTDSSFFSGSTVKVAGASVLAADAQPAGGVQSPFVFQHYSPWLPVLAQVTYENGVTLTPSPGGQAFSGGITTTIATVPSLRATGAPVGSGWTCTAHGDANDLVVLAVTVDVNAQTLLGLPMILAAGTAIVADFAILGAAGQAAFTTIAVPNQPTLRGTVLQGSAVTLRPTGALDISNPVSGVLH